MIPQAPQTADPDSTLPSRLDSTGLFMSDISSLLTGDVSGIAAPSPRSSLELSPLCTPFEQKHYLPSLHESTSPSAETSRSSNTSSRSRRFSATSNLASDAPRPIYPIPSPVSLRLLTDPVGYREAFKRCLIQSQFATNPVSTVFLPLLWPSLELSPKDLARVLGHRNKWAAPLPARTSTIPPEKADPFLRFFSFLVKGFRCGIDRSQITAYLTQDVLPPTDPIPTHHDLVTAFRSIMEASSLAKNSHDTVASQTSPGCSSDEVFSSLLPQKTPTEGAIEFAGSPPQASSSSHPGAPHSIHPTRWPEAVSHLGLSHFHCDRPVTPLQLLRTLPAVTTADLVYLAEQLFDLSKSILDDLHRGAEILLKYVMSLRNESSTDQTLARHFLSPLTCVRLAAFSRALSRVDSSDLPILVRAGLPPAFLFAIADFLHLGRLGPPFRTVPALVGISPMTLRSRDVDSRGGRLSPTETDTAFRLLILLGTLGRVFSGLPALRSWAHGEMGGLHPLSLICNSSIGLSSGLLFRFRQALLPDRPPFW